MVDWFVDWFIKEIDLEVLFRIPANYLMQILRNCLYVKVIEN